MLEIARKQAQNCDGVYQRGWICDMKELPSGKDVIPFYTVGTLSTNVLENYFTNPPAQMAPFILFWTKRERIKTK